MKAALISTLCVDTAQCKKTVPLQRGAHLPLERWTTRWCLLRVVPSEPVCRLNLNELSFSPAGTSFFDVLVVVGAIGNVALLQEARRRSVFVVKGRCGLHLQLRRRLRCGKRSRKRTIDCPRSHRQSGRGDAQRSRRPGGSSAGAECAL